MVVNDTPEPRCNYPPSLCVQSVSSLLGPLRQLRLSSITPDAQPTGIARPTKGGKDTKKRLYLKQIQSRKSSHDAGFGFDIDFPVSGGRRSTCETSSRLSVAPKDSLQMATIFLTSAKSAKSKYNVIDSIQATGLSNLLRLPEGNPIHISPSVRRRADVVKSALELKYTWINRVVEPAEDQIMDNLGLDHSFNPLQVLRNRVTRKKLHHSMPPLPQYPLPCDAFSSHQIIGGKPWKMLWGIDLSELIADYAWRKVHWAELRNARSELWYPEASDSRESTPKPRRLSQRLHDKLWTDSDSDKQREDHLVVEIPFQNRTKELGAKGIRTNLKEKAKRLYGLQSSSAVDLQVQNYPSHAHLKSLDGLSAITIARVARSKSADDHDLLYQFKVDGSGGLDGVVTEDLINSKPPRDRMFQPPQIFIGDDEVSRQLLYSDTVEEEAEEEVDKVEELFNNINDVYFSSAHTKLPLVQHVEQSPMSESSQSVEVCPLNTTIPDDIQLQSTVALIKFLGATTLLSCNFLSSVYPVLLESTISKLDTLLHQDMRQLLRSINQIHTGLLPERENLYKGFIEEAKSIIHLSNNDCAVKIDNLLSATDRSYSELNTSLVMELRKTSEKLDKLNRSLFSGAINSSAIDDRAQTYEISNHRFLYIALENGIVIILRLVWIGVNILKPVIIFVKILWRLLTLMFPSAD